MKKAKQLSGLPTLADLEREVVAEYRELGRQALERRLQQLADQTGELPPPAAAQTPPPDPAHRTGRGKADGGLRAAARHGPVA